MSNYKQKTRKGVSKRFKITGTGKVMRRRQMGRHLRRKKSKSAIRKFRVMVQVNGKTAIKIKHMLGIA